MGAALGIFLESIANLFEEISCSAGKKETQDGRASIYMMGFLQHVSTTILLLLVLLLGFEQFKFNPASIPFLSLRAILDIAQVHFTLQAIQISDRTAFSFIKLLTVPLLLLVDLSIGYTIDPIQIIGMLMLVGIFLFIFNGNVINKKGMALLIFSAVNPVLAISIYKYDITNFNSVMVEQVIIYVILTIYLFLMLKFKTKEKISPIAFKPVSLVQAVSMAFGGLLSSYAYLYAAPSIIVTARRASGILWSSLSGMLYFKEDHKKQKIFVGFLLIIVLILLAK
jgi:drug/metabolite transporter (DMT)-like permease